MLSRALRHPRPPREPAPPSTLHHPPRRPSRTTTAATSRPAIALHDRAVGPPPRRLAPPPTTSTPMVTHPMSPLFSRLSLASPEIHRRRHSAPRLPRSPIICSLRACPCHGHAARRLASARTAHGLASASLSLSSTPARVAPYHCYTSPPPCPPTSGSSSTQDLRRTSTTTPPTSSTPRHLTRYSLPPTAPGSPLRASVSSPSFSPTPPDTRASTSYTRSTPSPPLSIGLTLTLCHQPGQQRRLRPDQPGLRVHCPPRCKPVYRRAHYPSRQSGGRALPRRRHNRRRARRPQTRHPRPRRLP